MSTIVAMTATSVVVRRSHRFGAIRYLPSPGPAGDGDARTITRRKVRWHPPFGYSAPASSSVRSATEGCLRLGHGPVRLHPVPRLPDAPFLVDEERRPDDAHVHLAVQLLLSPGPPRIRDRVVGIGEQREPERELLVERELARRLVGRDADDVDTEVAELLPVIAKVARLGGAPRVCRPPDRSTRAASCLGSRRGARSRRAGRRARTAERDHLRRGSSSRHDIPPPVGLRGQGRPTADDGIDPAHTVSGRCERHVQAYLARDRRFR